MSLIKKERSPYWYWDIKISDETAHAHGYETTRFRGSTKTISKPDALRIEAQVRQALLNGTFKPPQATTTALKPSSSMLVQVCLERALNELWVNHKSYQSFYCVNVRSFRKDAISSLMVGDLTTEVINQWVNDKLAQGNARSTINQKMGILQAATTRAVKVWGVSMPLIEWGDLKLKKAVNAHGVWFNDEIEAQIHDHLRHNGRQDLIDLFIVLADVGARFSSIIELHRDQVSLGDRTIKLLDTKNGDDITLPLTARALAVFALRADKVHPFDDVTYSGARQAWDRMRKHFGWPSGEGYKIHALRHTCGTKLAAAGVDIRVIQKWLGHRDIRQTARYTHVLDDQLTAARDKLDKS